MIRCEGGSVEHVILFGFAAEFKKIKMSGSKGWPTGVPETAHILDCEKGVSISILMSEAFLNSLPASAFR